MFADRRPAGRIALFLPNLGGGGAERVVVNLAAGLSERGFEVDLVLMQVTGELIGQVPEGVRVVDLGRGRARYSAWSMVKYLRRERPVLLLAHLPAASMVAVVARKLARVATTLGVVVHNDVRRMDETERHPLRRIFPILLRLTYSAADHIIAVSEGVADGLQTLGVPRERIKVIYNPVVSERMLELASRPVTHKWLGPNRSPLLIAIGRLSKEKDYPVLLEAVAMLRGRRPVNLLVLGEGVERQPLEQLAASLGIEEHVDFAGYVANPYAYLARADVLVLSSRSEGLPTVLIEALALGTRVVSTDCESGPREILAGGEYGRLVPVGRPDLLANAVQEALAEPPPQGVEEAWSRFTFEAAVDRYVEMYPGQHVT